MSHSRSLSPCRRAALALALTAGLLTPAQAAPPAVEGVPAPAPTIGLDEIAKGQQGYGLSVFAGSEPERFELEVLGVLQDLSPGLSYIMARLSGQGLERSGVIAGMSGSPVYIDDRLAGAVAFSWPFSHEAIAGITPIAAMRRIPEGGAPAAAAGSQRPRMQVALRDLLPAELPAGLLGLPAAEGRGEGAERRWQSPAGLALLEGELGRLAAPLAGGAAPAVHWTLSGFGEVTAGLLGRALGSAGRGGRMQPPGAAGAAGGEGPPAAPAAGGMVAAVLMDGDLHLAATATVTDVLEDRILSFGHPFLGLGPVAVPMARAEVITVISSLNNSFKLSNVGEVIGSFDQDRRAGVQGRVGKMVPTVPMEVRVRGVDREQAFAMRLAPVQGFGPALVATAVIGSLEVASWRAGEQGLDLTARFEMAGHPPLLLHQSFDGPAAGIESATYLLTLAAYLLQNTLAEVELTRIEVDLVQHPAPRTATLLDAHAESTVVRPGERVELNLDLAAFRGEPFRHSLAVQLPEDLPAGRYSLLVGDGASIDVARLAVESAEPVSFQQALALLSSFHSRRELAVLGVFPSQGLAVAGQPMPRLPGSVLSLWGRSSSAGAVPLRLAVAQEHSEPFPVPLSGIVRVDVEVRRREPVSGAEGAETGEGAAPGGGEGGVAAAQGRARHEGRTATEGEGR